MSRFSTTASIIRSQSLSFGRSSSKLPIVTSDALSGVKNAAGFAVFAASNPARAIRLRTPFDSSVRPLPCSSTVNSRGAISSRIVGTPAFARWAAICAPMVPAPKTAAFSIRVIGRTGIHACLFSFPGKASEFPVKFKDTIILNEYSFRQGLDVDYKDSFFVAISPCSPKRWARRFAQILLQPAIDFLIPVAAVFAFGDPVVFFGPHDEPAGNTQALQHAPVFQRLIKWNAEVVFADGEQDRRAEVFGKADRILLAPNRSLLPNRAAITDFARIDRVAGAPLRLEIDQTGVTNQCFVARRCCLHPICQVPAIACARSRLPRAVYKLVETNRFIRGFVDLIARTLQRIALNAMGKSFAKTRGT